MPLSDSIRSAPATLRLLAALLLFCHAAAAGAAGDYAAGVAAAEAGDYETARAAWLPLAEAGDPASQFNMGMLYARGDGVAQDYAEAARWFRLAAEQGQVEAQAHLGGMYVRGLGVEQDYGEAVRWLGRAAEQHHKQSQYELGMLFANGQGVARDLGVAYFWFSIAGFQNYPPALDAKNRMMSHMHPSEMAMIEQRAQEWLEKSVPAENRPTPPP